jgi:hypothetical protein
MTQTPIHDAVREHYAERARKSDSCCGPDSGVSLLRHEERYLR